MELFEKVMSGIPSLDKLLDYIRLGDNVVFQVSDLTEYTFFVDRFVKQAKEDGRRIVYIRFAQHEPIVGESDAVRYCLHPDDGFEAFTVSVHNIIKEEGEGVFYIFDCLSELQVAWAADLMMGNFFCVTCPFLFKLNTVALFPVMRGDHSFDTLARIRDTTQLFLNVFSFEGMLYLHPLKVWNRYSPTMFMPHYTRMDEACFSALTDAVGISKYYAVVAKSEKQEDQNLDSWERYFQKCRTAGREKDKKICSDFCRMMMTKDEKIRGLFDRFFTREDYYRVKERMIGTGRIGGKSSGMLLSRSIVSKKLPELSERMEPHDSFYIGDHVFYTFLVYNNLWELCIAQKEEDGYFSLAEQMAQGILGGTFPDNIREKFKRMLEYFGQSPIIVRSSGVLEDVYGNAFAGKYESVFCVNQGDAQERLYAFENAVKTVYASTMNPSALEYRASRGLRDKDEQMSILVQRVSGSIVGDYFYPSAGGVGYSYDPYRWNRSIDPKRGMLRMVCGLGTRAVDRTDADYPRIIHIDKPLQSALVTADERVRFSQHYVDVLDMRQNHIRSVPLDGIAENAPGWYKNYVTDHDAAAESRLREKGGYGSVIYATCRGFAENGRFLADMESIMTALHSEYRFPVDIEYTVNLSPNGEYVICLLQCRPLQISDDKGGISVPPLEELNILFESKNASMGVSQRKTVDIVVMVDAKAYHRLSYRSKSEVANIISDINRKYRKSEKMLMLISPGRIGTSSPELGVPLKFSGISQFSAIVEYDDAEDGYLPELSFGSHMFQDLVESRIFYTALFSMGTNPAEFEKGLLSENARIIPLDEDRKEFGDIVSVFDTSGKNLVLYYDMVSDRTICAFEKNM